VGDIIMGACFGLFGQFYQALGANPTCNFFGSSFFWKPSYHLSFYSLWLACWHVWSQNYGSKTKNWTKFKSLKR